MSTTNGHRRWRFLAVVIAIVALNVLFAAPASADGCDVPLPERPGDGLVGTIDLPKTDRGNPVDSAYGKYSYAGSTWHTYTTGSACSLPSGMSDLAHPWDQTDTRLGNQLFDVGKGFVAVHNDLWYTLHSQDSPLGWLDPQIKHLAQVMYNGPFTVFLGVVLVLVAGVVLTLIITGNLAQVMAKSAGILAGLWLAGTAITMPLVYTTLVDGLMYDTVGGLQTQALGHGQHDPQDAIPDLLYNKVIGDTWAQGEFGDTQSPLAQKYGAELLDSQAWRKSDVSQDPTTDQKRLQDKQNEYKDVANKLQNTDAWPYFTDTSDSRVGVGALGALRGIAYTTFPIFAEFGQFLATALIRVLVITAPLLGLFMLLQHRMAFRLARGLGHAFGACLFLALGSVVYLLLVQAVLAANAPTFIQIMFLAIATLIALITVRPIQQMKTILGGMMTAAGMENAGNTVTNGRFFSREWWRQHRLAKTMQSQLGAERRTAAGVDRTADGVNRRREEWLTPQNPDDFLPPPHLRKRPEGNTNDTDAADSKPIQATAERLDQEPRGPIRATATRTDRPPA
ncbi:MAG: DMT family transporter, partial [Mycobacterium sp.]|nr:DMT family transporter [Mycobacterium sp.]